MVDLIVNLLHHRQWRSCRKARSWSGHRCCRSVLVALVCALTGLYLLCGASEHDSHRGIGVHLLPMRLWAEPDRVVHRVEDLILEYAFSNMSVERQASLLTCQLTY